MDTPVSLLERLRRPGDAEAWARFVRLYTPLLCHWARRTGLQDADAADLVQEVLTHLFRKLPEFTYDRSQSFRGWLRTVLRNKWRDGLRRRQDITAGGEAALAGLAAADDGPAVEEAEYRRHLVTEGLRALRGEVPPATWKAFERHVIDGRPAREVAKELGIQVGTVYAAKSRVLNRLRRELAGLLD